MLHAIAIDDEPLPLELLQIYCEDSGFVSLKKTFTRTDEARRYLANYPVDLIFLDIQMPKITGIDFYKSLSQNTMVIFTTAHSQYAVEGFNVSAVDYLLKPFSYERFLEAARKAQAAHQLRTALSPRPQLFLRAQYSLVPVDIDEILFVESFADYLDIHLAQAKPLTVRMTLKSLLEKLPADKFLRVHRSFVVALRHVEKVRHKTISIGGRELPISPNFEADFLRHFGG